jgi:hypothetical protein
VRAQQGDPIDDELAGGYLYRSLRVGAELARAGFGVPRLRACGALGGRGGALGEQEGQVWGAQGGLAITGERSWFMLTPAARL